MEVGDGRPRVLIVGGEDVHKRLELMEELRPAYHVSAAGSDPGLEALFAERGFDFHFFPLSRGAAPISDLRTVSTLVRLIRRVDPDVVHAFATKPAVWGRIAARRAGVSVVVGTVPGLGSLYSSPHWTSRMVRPIYETLQRWACRSSDATIFQNRTDRDEMVSSGVCPADKATVIPSSGVRMDRFTRASVPASEIHELRREIGADDGSIVVTMVSRLIRSKGVLEFARAAPLVRERIPDARFLLVGPEDPDSVESLTPGQLEEVRTRVRWIGERTDVPIILAASDVFALPSFYREGIPRVLIEAMAMGLPVVSHPNPGSAEVIENGVNGLLVESTDAGRLAGAIIRLASDAEVRKEMGERGRQTAEERFDIRVIARMTRELYESHLPSRMGRRQPPLGEVAVST